ncbi:structural protein [Fiji disease virus]|uniref:Non-structural protein P9-1 n=13 Tax=Fiji disease virus TaxID=77698 RepID=VP91_FDVS|nr:structural protein [Fiji disease virus]Q9YX38.1 RecName: Full=Non-structural protein P9-1 [Fiji disease virus isolate Sugarcane]AAD04815.1 structural protein [Fiji disease virus]
MMADSTRNAFGAYSITEIITTRNQNNFNANTKNQNQNTSNTQSSGGITRKPVMNDGLYALFDQLLKGVTFEESIYRGYDYSHLPNLETVFNTASDYVNGQYKIGFSEAQLDGYTLNKTFSVIMPEFSFSLEFIKNEEQSDRNPDENEQLKPKTRRIVVELVSLFNRDEIEYTPEQVRGEIALIALFKLYITGFLYHLNVNKSVYDQQLNLEKYRPLLVAIVGFESIDVKLKKLTPLYYTLATFSNYPLNILRYSLKTIVEVTNEMDQIIKRDGLFKQIDIKPMLGNTMSVGYSLRGIDNSSLFLAPKHYRQVRSRDDSNVREIISYDLSKIDFGF